MKKYLFAIICTLIVILVCSCSDKNVSGNVTDSTDIGSNKDSTDIESTNETSTYKSTVIAYGQYVIYDTYYDLFKESDAVITGKVISYETTVRAETAAPMIGLSDVKTIYTVSVTDVLRGNVSAGDELKVIQLGGVYDGVLYTIHGIEQPEVGYEYVMVLSINEENNNYWGMAGQYNVKLNEGYCVIPENSLLNNMDYELIGKVKAVDYLYYLKQVAASTPLKEKLFRNLTADDILYIDVIYLRDIHKKIYTITESAKIQEFVGILNTMVTYGDGEAAVAGNFDAPLFTVYMADGSKAEILPCDVIYINNKKYEARSILLERLFQLGMDWVNWDIPIDTN